MRRRAHPHEHQGELNIVPYLDIMVNLVMFMLMSMTGFISFQIVNVNMPSIARGLSQETPPPWDHVEKLNLSVLMSPKGYNIAAKGGTLPDEMQNVAKEVTGVDQSGQPTIPVKMGRDFEYDYDKLRELMTKIKQQNVAISQYTLVPDKNVKYDCIVKTLDYTRGEPDHLLFPDVAFAAITKT